MSSAALLCPSAPGYAEDARIIGIVGGTADGPEVAYLSHPLSIQDDAVRSILVNDANPTEYLRLAAICQSSCTHFSGSHCRLVERLVNILPVVVNGLPECGIRANCRWFREHGREACVRCPQVVTENYQSTEAMHEVGAVAI